MFIFYSISQSTGFHSYDDQNLVCHLALLTTRAQDLIAQLDERDGDSGEYIRYQKSMEATNVSN